MSNPTTDKILRYALGGACAGIIVFLLLNPSISRQEVSPQRVRDIGEAIVEVFADALLLGAVIGLAMGCFLVLAEESGTWNTMRLKRYLPIAAGVGLVGGAAAGTIGQFAFSILLLINLILARTVGWCLMGAVAGACPGAAYANRKKAAHGALGGLIGGGIGGILFDAIAFATQGGGASRLVGFVAMGIAIGAAVALVEEIAKEHWITVLTGSREGRSYIISKPETTIGRDELADIPLFGDPSIQKLHAKLVKQDSGFSVVAQPGLTVTVNNAPTASAVLADGAIIGIGSHRLRFSTKTRAFAPAPQPAAPSAWTTPPSTVGPPTPQVPVYVAAQPTMLTVISGPRAGESFGITVGSAVIGRDPACNIRLPQDGMVSRNHARITWDGTTLRIEDLGSTNGLFVNGQRVTHAVLSLGDTIGLGQSTIRVS